MKTKQLVIRISIVLAILLVICLLLSNSIHNMMLPEVTITLPTSGSLAEQSQYTVDVGFARTEDIEATKPWTVTSVEVFVGMEVEEGDLLLTVDTTDAQLEREQLALNVKRAKETVANSYGLNREQAKIDLKNAERALEKHDEAYPNGTEVLSPVKGRVVAVGCKVGEGNLGKMVCIETDKSTVCFELNVPTKTAEALEIGSRVDCSVYDRADFRLNDTAWIQSVEPGTDGYTTLRVYLDADETVPVNAEASITISGESKAYTTVVPRAAVKSTQSGHYIYVVSEESSLFGRTYICRAVSVEWLDENSKYTAIKVKLEKDERVVVYASKSIEDGMQVRIAG